MNWNALKAVFLATLISVFTAGAQAGPIEPEGFANFHSDYLVGLEVDPLSNVISILPVGGNQGPAPSFTFVSAVCVDCNQSCSTPGQRTIEVQMQAQETIWAGFGVSKLSTVNWDMTSVNHSSDMLNSGDTVTITLQGDLRECSAFRLYFSICEVAPSAPTESCLAFLMPATICSHPANLLNNNCGLDHGIGDWTATYGSIGHESIEGHDSPGALTHQTELVPPTAYGVGGSLCVSGIRPHTNYDAGFFVKKLAQVPEPICGIFLWEHTDQNCGVDNGVNSSPGPGFSDEWNHVNCNFTTNAYTFSVEFVYECVVITDLPYPQPILFDDFYLGEGMH